MQHREIVKKYRLDHFLTQEVIAIDIGVSRENYCRYEKGQEFGLEFNRKIYEWLKKKHLLPKKNG